MKKPYFYWVFFLPDWRHKRLKKTTDLLLFYGEHFYWFSEMGIWFILAPASGPHVRPPSPVSHNIFISSNLI